MSADELGDPDRLAAAIDDAPDEPPGSGGGGGGGPLSGLGPLSNTEPNPDLDRVDAPGFSRDTARKLSWRAILKIQGARDATAALDLIMAGVAWTVAAFLAEPEEAETAGGEPVETADAADLEVAER
jgi:hypothetical protein